MYDTDDYLFFGDEERAEKTISLLDKAILIQDYYEDLNNYDSMVKEEGMQLVSSNPFENIVNNERCAEKWFNSTRTILKISMKHSMSIIYRGE